MSNFHLLDVVVRGKINSIIWRFNCLRVETSLFNICVVFAGLRINTTVIVQKAGSHNKFGVNIKENEFD